MKTNGLQNMLTKLFVIMAVICLAVGVSLAVGKPIVRAAEMENSVPNANFANTDLSYTDLRWSDGGGKSEIDTK